MIHSEYWLRTDDITNELLNDDDFMNMYLQSIKQFVKIITDADIAIKYSTDTTHYTNKNIITISRDLDSVDDLDVVVALVLQYSSIIEYSDSTILNYLSKYSKSKVDKLIGHLDISSNLTSPQLFEIYNIFTVVFKFIEYRRVDKLIVTKYVGYREYYNALYAKLFFNSDIDTLLLTHDFKPDFKSYTIAILNVLHDYYDNLKLTNLDRIKQLIDITNIHRLDSTYQSFILTKNIISEVISNISFDDDNITKPRKSHEDSLNDAAAQYSETNNKSLDNLIKQINGEISNVNLHINQTQTVNNIHDVYIENKAYSIELYRNASTIEYQNKAYSYKRIIQKAINNSKKMRLFGNQNISFISYDNTDCGILDTNKLHKLTLNDTVIFKQFKIVEIEQVTIHISLDMSSSITKSIHEQQLYISTLIASAALRTKNVSVKLSLRFASSTKCKLFMYDINKISDFSLLYYIQPYGSTPESLCYPLIFSDLLKYTGKRIFITFSDGVPLYNNYRGDFAINHTNKIWRSDNNIHKLAYFLGNDDKLLNNFYKSYPTNSYTIQESNQLSMIMKHLKKIIKS